MIRKVMFMAFLCFLSSGIYAQNNKIFKGHLYNNAYKVYLDIDFYDNNIVVPGQELLGELSGFFGAKRDSRKWLITSVELLDSKTAKLSIINDYGSEDLEATLTVQKDGSFVLHQKSGSRIKIVVDRKWVKIPNNLVFLKTDKDEKSTLNKKE